LFGAWGGAGGAVTSCLKLHEVFTEPSAHQIPLQSALSGFLFFFFFSPLSISSVLKGKGTLGRLVGLLMDTLILISYII